MIADQRLKLYRRSTISQPVPWESPRTRYGLVGTGLLVGSQASRSVVNLGDSITMRAGAPEIDKNAP